MEKQRERLVELLLKCDKESEVLDCFNERPTKKQSADLIADYLMSNNVVVLPCKVGDKIFAVSASLKTIYECEVTHIISQKGGLMIFGTLPYCKEPRAICSEYDIGKDYVFLSREEVENALKERKNEK